MAAKKGYKPALITVASITTQIIYTTKEISTDYWSLALIYGLAKAPGGTALPSSAVIIWRNSLTAGELSLSNAYAVTFTDDKGRYGITVDTGDGYKVRVYGFSS